MDDDDLARAREVERLARLLVEHVAVEMLRPEQSDPAVERLALGANAGLGGLRLVELLRQVQPSDEPAVAFHQMVGEIAGEADAEDGPGDDAGPLANLGGEQHDPMNHASIHWS